MTINMISLFGFILVLGMLVDDAIVIAENSYRYMEEGMSPKEAAVKGAQEVFYPVLAAILTTVAAFYPLLTMKGIMGKFIRNIPMVVIIALSASLFEAFFILPSHIADFVKPLKSKHHTKKKKTKRENFFIEFIKHYFFTSHKKGNEVIVESVASVAKQILFSSLNADYAEIGRVMTDSYGSRDFPIVVNHLSQ
jgi:multidrug efflux pump subunit AcrB